jgi:hypothetical protein
MTSTHAAVESLTTRTEAAGHKVCIDNFFSSPDFMTTCMKELSAVVHLLDKIVKRYKNAALDQREGQQVGPPTSYT